jgi:hypothetical protein
VVLDTSGSIDDGEMQRVSRRGQRHQGPAAGAHHAARLRRPAGADGPWRCEPWEELTLPRRFPAAVARISVPAFEWLARLDRAAGPAGVFHRRRRRIPQARRIFPVMWLVKGKAKVPWGQRIQLN